MRPRNDVLLYCPSEDDANVLRFVISNHIRLRAHVATTVSELERALLSPPPNLRRIVLAITGWSRIRPRLRQLMGRVSFSGGVFVYGMSDKQIPGMTGFVSAGLVSELMERIITSVVRKRGPSVSTIRAHSKSESAISQLHLL